MSILEYYKEQQKYPLWYEKFQSTGRDKSGTIFYYTSTNYRGVKSFLSQLHKFEKNDGKERSEWDKQKISGQEADKHRITDLINANMLKAEEEYYFLTNIGYTCMDLYEMGFKEVDNWILIYLLLLIYKNEYREKDIIQTTKEYISYFSELGIKASTFQEECKSLLRINNIEKLFSQDYFWLLSFINDMKFVELYMKAKDKEDLWNYAYKEYTNKKSTDCIGHKFNRWCIYKKYVYR